MKFKEIFDTALEEEDKLHRLRDAVIKLRSEGVDKETLISELSQYYKVADNEKNQDTAADVLDFLYGFCSPHMRID